MTNTDNAANCIITLKLVISRDQRTAKQRAVDLAMDIAGVLGIFAGGLIALFGVAVIIAHL